MAKRVLEELVDDFDGSEAAETVTFGLDGATYQLDLSEENASILRDRLAPFVDHARRAGGGKGRPRGRGRRAVAAAAKTADPAAIRAWAQSQGIEVNTRGRISQRIVERFKQAMGS